MQEIGEQLDSAILAYVILLQLMHCSIASCVLHIAYCMLHWYKIPLPVNQFSVHFKKVQMRIFPLVMCEVTASRRARAHRRESTSIYYAQLGESSRT